jgi:hypothetical protein
MSLNAAAIDALPSVATNLNYLVPSAEKPFRYTYEPPAGVPVDNCSYEARPFRIYDARSIAPRVSLDEEGFALVQHQSAVTNFYDVDEIRRVYYPEAVRLMTEATGAVKVHVFDHLMRRRGEGRPPLDSGRSSSSTLRGPVGRAHNDFTVNSAPARVRLELGAEAEELLKLRFAVINVWRPIRGPLLDAPLAVCDARSVAFEDLVASDLIYPNRTGETYQLKYNPAHRWFYVSALQEDEALLLKCYDSAEDGRARFVPHTAFEDPTTPQDAHPRESIELRTFVFYGD